MAPLLLGVATIAFLLIHVIPGDPAEAMLPPEAPHEAVEALRHELGLDRPILTQYLSHLSRLLRGDLGRSIVTKRPVIAELMLRIPATVELTISAMLLSTVLGVPLGLLAASRQNKAADHLATLASWMGIAMPTFLFGLLLMLLFSVQLGWFPTFGRGSFRHMVLPAVTLAAYSTAVLARVVRASVLEVSHQDFVRTAQAKGLPQITVLTRHVFRNALVPTVTIMGLQVGYMLGGAVVTETLFAWPGIGRYAVQALFSRDLPVIQGVVILTAVVVSAINLIVDLLYAAIDPRISYS